MALTALNWKQIANFSGLLTVDAIDSFFNQTVYAALTATTYYNGATRTQGSGSAVTVSREQIAALTRAVYWTYASSSISSTRGIMAGDIAAATPPLGSPDTTFATNIAYASSAKNAGAFNTWANAAPFTSGQFMGYWRGPTLALAQTWSCSVHESQEAIVVALNNTAASSVYGFILGCYIDPLSTQATDADSDGRVVGMISSANNSVSSTFITNPLFGGGAGQIYTEHNTTANTGVHSGFMTPGASATIITTERATAIANDVSTSGITVGGVYQAAFGMAMKRASTNNWCGVLRQMGSGYRCPVGTVFTNSGADAAYCAIGGNYVSTGSSLLVAA